MSNRLGRPVNDGFDHTLGPANVAIALVEYGSCACPYCWAANERIAQVRDQFGDRLRYVFRHRTVPGSDIARRAAELAERAADPRRFWDAHRSDTLTDLHAPFGFVLRGSSFRMPLLDWINEGLLTIFFLVVGERH